MKLNEAKEILENKGYTILETNGIGSEITNKKLRKMLDDAGLSDVHLIKGDGYLYVDADNGQHADWLYALDSTALYSNSFGQASPETWFSEIVSMLNQGRKEKKEDFEMTMLSNLGESVNEAMAKQNDDGTYDVDLDDETGDKPAQRVFNFKKPVDADAEEKMNEIVDKMEEKGYIFIGVTPSKNEYYYGHLDFKYIDKDIPVYTSIFLGWVPEGSKDDYYFAVDTDVPKSVISTYCGKTTNSKHVQTIDEIVKSASIATKSTITVTLRELAWKKQIGETVNEAADQEKQNFRNFLVNMNVYEKELKGAAWKLIRKYNLNPDILNDLLRYMSDSDIIKDWAEQNTIGALVRRTEKLDTFNTFIETHNETVNEDFCQGVGAPLGADQGIPHSGDCIAVPMMKLGDPAPYGKIQKLPGPAPVFMRAPIIGSYKKKKKKKKNKKYR